MQRYKILLSLALAGLFSIGTLGAAPYEIGSATITATSVNKQVFLKYPQQGGVPVTGVPFPLLVVGHGAGGNGSGSSGIYAHMAAAGYLVAAPSFGTSFNPSTYSNEVTAIITELLGRGDLPVSIDSSKIGYSGTSMGGIIGLSKFRVDRYDARIKAIYVRAASTALAGGTYDWSVATPLLFLHGNADTTVQIGPARTDYANAFAPKGFIELNGVGHDLAFSPAGTFYNDVAEGFFDYFLKGNTAGLDRIQSAVNLVNTNVGAGFATYSTQWGPPPAAVKSWTQFE